MPTSSSVPTSLGMHWEVLQARGTGREEPGRPPGAPLLAGADAGVPQVTGQRDGPKDGRLEVSQGLGEKNALWPGRKAKPKT